MTYADERTVDDLSPLHSLADRRSDTDRRHRRLQAFFYQFFKSRRVGERRDEHDGNHHYVDVHGAGVLLIILLILMLCIADAYLTLALLSHGGEELNPVMKVLIEHDVGVFFYSKYLVTAFSLIILLMHKNARVFGGISGHQILFTVLLAYAFLISYEIRLVQAADIPLLS